MGFNYNLFIANKLPAQWAFRTTAGLTLPLQGIQVNEISPTDYGIHTHGHTIITSEKMIKAKPEIVKAFLISVIEGIKYSLNNNEETIASIKKRDKNFKEELAASQLKIYDSIFEKSDSLCWIDTTLLEQTKLRMVNLGLLSKGFNLNNAINNNFLIEYYKK